MWPARTASSAAATARSLQLGACTVPSLLETEAGLFILTGEVIGSAVATELLGPDDLAFVAHTSGTEESTIPR